jgi:hypothetical protein
MKKFAAACALLVFWTSCERIIPFDPEDSDPVLVLYADLNPNLSLRAHLSRSVGILDQGDPQRISDAVVWIEDSAGLALDTLTPNPLEAGYYHSPLKPSAGQGYTVKASWRDLPAVSGFARPMALSGDFGMDSIGFSPGNGMFVTPHLIYRVAIDDDGVPGFYRLEFYEDQNDTAFGQQVIFAGTDDPLVSQPVFGGNFGGDISFDNALFLGQKRDLVVRVYKWSLTSPTKMKVSKVDEASARYRRSFENTQNSGGPFTQPVPIYSNVQGGFGLVGGEGHLWIRP